MRLATASSNSGPNVLFVLSSLRAGGVQSAASALLPALEREDYCFRVTVLDERDAVFREELDPYFLSLEASGFGTASLTRAVARLLRRTKPAIVVSVLPLPNLVVDLATRLYRLRMPHVSWEQNHIERNWLAHMPSIKRWAVEKLLSSCYRRSDMVIASSAGLGGWLEEGFGLSRGSVTILPNPVDLQRVAAHAGQDDPDWSPERVRLLAAGRLVGQKDFATLLRGVAACRFSERLSVRVAGEGPLLSELTDLRRQLGLEGSVEFIGYRPDLLRLMHQCDVFVLSSRWEGFGNVLVEAMACGCFVVATRCDFGPEEILQRGDCGALVEPGDPDAIAATLDQFVQNPDRFVGMREAAARRAADFDVSAVSSRLVGLLDEIRSPEPRRQRNGAAIS